VTYEIDFEALTPATRTALRELKVGEAVTFLAPDHNDPTRVRSYTLTLVARYEHKHESKFYQRQSRSSQSENVRLTTVEPAEKPNSQFRCSPRAPC
jgi:hypothetical protein